MLQKVLGITPGHSYENLGQPEYLRLLQNCAEWVIPVIRENDSNAVIIVGTPTWSQDIDKALADPLDFDNVMYALHFYADTHKDWLRQKAANCIEGGLPVFISECNICDASGRGKVNIEEGENGKKQQFKHC